MITTRRLFLIDGLGAVLSALGAGVLLPIFEAEVGMPASVLRGLALPALGFAVYSFVGAWLERRGLLFGIAAANATYAVVTVGVLLSFRGSIGWVGAGYFLGELGILAALVTIELRVALGS